MTTAISDRPLSISYDHICLKALGTLPFIGLLMNFIVENALVDSIKRADLDRNLQRVIKLIEIKNEYKWVSIMREIFMVALLVTGAALVILSGGSLSPVLALLCGVGALAMGCLMALHYYEIAHNLRVLEDLRKDNFPDLFGYEVK